jgi:hypothetical protein
LQLPLVGIEVVKSRFSLISGSSWRRAVFTVREFRTLASLGYG